MQAALRHHAPGRLAPGLRIASHNVRCLRGNEYSLVRFWHGQQYHIVCMQETHVAPD